MAGFEGINARVGGNVINPLPYLQQSQKANPWYNPLMKGPDLVGGMSATLNKLKVEEERKRREGLEEREMVTKEKATTAGVSQKEAMAEYYKAQAKATGKGAEKTLSKKDQMMYKTMVEEYGVDSPEVESFVVNGFKIVDPDTEYPASMVVPALGYISKLQKKTITQEQFSKMSKSGQKAIIDRYYDSLEAAEAGKTTDVLSPESVQSNRNAEIRFVRDTFDSEMAELILLGQYEDSPERIKAFAAQTDVRLDLPHEHSVIKRLEKRNPELVNNEQRAYVKLIDSTSNTFFKMWGKHGDEFFEEFEKPEFMDKIFEFDDIDVDAFYWMYFIHSGRYASMVDKGKEKGNVLMDLLELINKAKTAVTGYYEK
jgi:hypothetical protein